MKIGKLSIEEKAAKKKAYDKAYRLRKKEEMHMAESSTPVVDEVEEKVDATTEVAKPKAKKEKKEKVEAVTKDTIEILSALYGINSVKVEVKDSIKVGRKITNKMIGQDPAPKEKKELYIKAVVNGTEIEKTFAEGEKIIF